MNTLRAWCAHMWRAHCRIAASITPRRFALLWDGVAVGCFVGAILAPDPASGLALSVIGLMAVGMAWMNATGRIRE